MVTLVLIVHAAVTWMMTGVIWYIQLAHYPSYRHLKEAGFIHCQAELVFRTAFVVVPLMFAELLSGAWLLFVHPAGLDVRWLTAGFALILLNWIFTVAIQAPLHARLLSSYDRRAIERLVTTNWLRAVTWSLRAGLVGWLLLGAFGPR